jgi:hypothetical protein
MNLKTAFLTIAVVIVASQSEAAEISDAIQLGEISLAGSACTQVGSGKIRQIQAGVYDIPLTLAVAKDLNSGLERGTCAFALPVQVAQGYRLVISDVLAKASLNLRVGSKSRLDIEIFKAGTVTKPLTGTHEAVDKRIVGSYRLSRSGIVVATECGEGIILRGNASALLQGSARAQISLDALRLKARLEKCN